MKYLPYFHLCIAIITEVIGTSAIKATEEFTKIIPIIIVAVSYTISFYFLSLTLKFIPVGIAYAIWAGLGIVLIAIVGFVIYKQSLDLAAILGISMIIAGVITIQLFSKSLSH